MKTLAYRDLGGGPVMVANFTENVIRDTRVSRLNNLLKELKHVGNIAVYLVNGNKTRLLFKRGL